ncbi:Curli production assembly/transport component CsgG [Desulfocurvibacter africanus subsp. africanus str. Walvis Bay]|uniref:Curli production assembly/transport component CsgG n=1 Tax=Desulfocurvibacter africanus subsp. africanus str. Walvis Bay TaxID=690850 RepID=F3YWZ4_DESAF|nr:Curli production assembly/transport component CsgG [Desulfocurvibacter africanus subsp. africanus str. Walvis Bay]
MLRVVVSLFAVMLLVSGCATTERPKAKRVEGAPAAVSPTVEQAATFDKRGVKRKVAIGRFTNESKYGQSFFLDKESKDRLGKQAVDILSTKLVATEKFILIERADLDKIQKELGIGGKGEYRNMADYLVLGSVTEFGRKDVGDVGVFSRTKRQMAFAKVHIRLVEVATGQIVYSEEGSGEVYSEAGSVFGVGTRAGYDTTLNDKAIEAAITNVASNIIENLLERPWKGYILARNAGQYLISGGKTQNIKAGDVFEVVAEGQKVRNPQTNAVITLPGEVVGRLRVTATFGETAENEVSACELLNGSLTTWDATQNYEKLFIREAR